jgi:hypothetical protein
LSEQPGQQVDVGAIGKELGETPRVERKAVSQKAAIRDGTCGTPRVTRDAHTRNPAARIIALIRKAMRAPHTPRARTPTRRRMRIVAET